MSCKVAFIGLGVMGYPMAGFISKAGHNVTVYNRTKSKAEKWINNTREILQKPLLTRQKIVNLYLHVLEMIMTYERLL